MNRSSDMQLTFVDLLWPGDSLMHGAYRIGFGTLLMVLLTRIEIPLQPVPITGQTFGVLLVGALFGAKRGALCMISYLMLGMIGVPVFSNAGWGVGHIIGPTGGYLVGFALAAFMVGFLSERGWDRCILTTVFAMTLGTVVIYIAGVSWLSTFVGLNMAFKVGLLPFVIGDGLKIVCAALALPICWRTIGAARSFRTGPSG